MFFSGHGSPGMCWGVRLRCRYRWTWHCSISPHSCRAEGKQLVISTCNRNSCCNCYYSFIKLEFPMQLCKIPNTFCIRRKSSGPKSFVVKQRVEETFPGIVNILIEMHFFYFKFFFWSLILHWGESQLELTPAALFLLNYFSALTEELQGWPSQPAGCQPNTNQESNFQVGANFKQSKNCWESHESYPILQVKFMTVFWLLLIQL